MNYQKIIKEKGLKQIWIAKQLGISAAMMSMYLKGQTNMSPEKVNNLKIILNQ
ncbi:hypothetical protein GCM10023310_70880 [Paenibacillus vulneris]|uniref:HTH cro/C1-type domain-containing protein n=1 Tax=Paenibacillus vulneris TaxID=1133364 RepID=A0ABW3UGR3_9BACL